MKNRIRNLLLVVAGVLAGVTLTSGAQAAVARLTATRSNCAVYIDGQRTELTAYVINDENYVRLRDIGAKVDFNVYWDGTVQIESDKPYTGVAPEARHFIKSNGDYLYVRNLYETRRMQYTLMNLAGTNSNTSVNGKLRYGSKGTPYVRISLTIPDSAGAWSFWPWRDSELTKLFNSCPPGAYSVEAWDLYKDGVYNHTEYLVYVT